MDIIGIITAMDLSILIPALLAIIILAIINRALKSRKKRKNIYKTQYSYKREQEQIKSKFQFPKGASPAERWEEIQRKELLDYEKIHNKRPPISHWETTWNAARVEYNKKPFVMTKNENLFYKELAPIANAKGLNVFSKVRLADLIEPKIDKGDPRWDDDFYRICFKHVDFVLCEKKWNRVILIIELDDVTHMQRARDNRDIFIDRALQSAGIPILHTASTSGLDKKIDDLVS